MSLANLCAPFLLQWPMYWQTCPSDIYLYWWAYWRGIPLILVDRTAFQEEQHAIQIKQMSLTTQWTAFLLRWSMHLLRSANSVLSTLSLIYLCIRSAKKYDTRKNYRAISGLYGAALLSHCLATLQFSSSNQQCAGSISSAMHRPTWICAFWSANPPQTWLSKTSDRFTYLNLQTCLSAFQSSSSQALSDNSMTKI